MQQTLYLALRIQIFLFNPLNGSLHILLLIENGASDFFASIGQRSAQTANLRKRRLYFILPLLYVQHGKVMPRMYGFECAPKALFAHNLLFLSLL